MQTWCMHPLELLYEHIGNNPYHDRPGDPPPAPSVPVPNPSPFSLLPAPLIMLSQPSRRVLHQRLQNWSAIPAQLPSSACSFEKVLYRMEGGGQGPTMCCVFTVGCACWSGELGRYVAATKMQAAGQYAHVHQVYRNRRTIFMNGPYESQGTPETGDIK